MVSVKSASRYMYVTSASRYQSRSSMNIQGLIPLYSTELNEQFGLRLDYLRLLVECFRDHELSH